MYKKVISGLRVPDIGRDLVATVNNACLGAGATDRLLAVLDLWRHQEISYAQAIQLSGLPESQFSRVVSSLV
jgi:hypothetical protein